VACVAIPLFEPSQPAQSITIAHANNMVVFMAKTRSKVHAAT
jgi:hypothetical protein